MSDIIPPPFSAAATPAAPASGAAGAPANDYEGDSDDSYANDTDDSLRMHSDSILDEGQGGQTTSEAGPPPIQRQRSFSGPWTAPAEEGKS